MMSIRNMLLAGLVVVILLLLADAIFTVHERQRALVLRFGEITQVDLEPGLHWKLPIADDAKKFDGRIQTLDSPPERYFTLEKKPLMVDSFVKWRVSDVQTYYETTSGGDQTRAELLLRQRVNEGLRNQISRRDMHEVISGERDQLMADLTQQLNTEMRRDVGVDVIDVRVKQIDLPTEVSSAVYDRMNSEREIEAQNYRASGRQLDIGIRADADRQVVVIEAEAYREAEQIRGDGDAGAAAIYAEAYGADPEFYEFYRSINAYVSVFSQKGDLLVVDPNSEFFKYLKDGDG